LVSPHHLCVCVCVCVCVCGGFSTLATPLSCHKGTPTTRTHRHTMSYTHMCTHARTRLIRSHKPWPGADGVGGGAVQECALVSVLVRPGRGEPQGSASAWQQAAPTAGGAGKEKFIGRVGQCPLGSSVPRAAAGCTNCCRMHQLQVGRKKEIICARQCVKCEWCGQREGVVLWAHVCCMGGVAAGR